MSLYILACNHCRKDLGKVDTSLNNNEDILKSVCICNKCAEKMAEVVIPPMYTTKIATPTPLPLYGRKVKKRKTNKVYTFLQFKFDDIYDEVLLLDNEGNIFKADIEDIQFINIKDLI